MIALLDSDTLQAWDTDRHVISAPLISLLTH